MEVCWKTDWCSKCLRIITYMFSDTGLAQSLKGRKIGIHGSTSTLSTIRSWASLCQQTHLDCRLGMGPDEIENETGLPTRVIDVRSDGEDPFLFVTARKPAPFIALSHCWGGHNKATTTQLNYLSHQNNIPISSLPKTFQDAVQITRALDFRYLWIDSLCIIQDSKKDWMNEAQSMGEVYENAFCTIAAVEARDSRDGCFIKKEKYEDLVSVPYNSARELAYFAKPWPPGNLYFDQGSLVIHSTHRCFPPFRDR